MFKIKGMIQLFLFFSSVFYSNTNGSHQFVKIDQPLVIKSNEKPKKQLINQAEVSLNAAKPSEIIIPLKPMIFQAEDLPIDLSAAQRNRVRLAARKAHIAEGRTLIDYEEDGSGSASSTVISQYNLVGPIEISGGLAITQKHHLEIRRVHHGVPAELGVVDLSRGEYKIQLTDFKGEISAQLLDESGKVLGEGMVSLLALKMNPKNPVGPKIDVRPVVGFDISHISSYRGKKQTSKMSILNKGHQESGNQIKQNQVKRGASTLVHAESEGHMPSNYIATAGIEETVEELPLSMVKALYSILFDREASEQDLKNMHIIWGQAVTDDNKPLFGVDVSIESHNEAHAIYFNELMIPDLSLKQTSTNGYFAFIDVADGYQSLVAHRGQVYFGHENVFIEPGRIAYSRIFSSIHKQSSIVRTFDSFSGVPVDARIIMQSQPEEISTLNGQSYLIESKTNKSSLAVASPYLPEYLEAQYFYLSGSSSMSFPLISKTWMNYFSDKTGLPLQANPSLSNQVMGFVPDEDYEVYLEGLGGLEDDQIENAQIHYFDNKGQLLSRSEGRAGGGFLISGVPEGTVELIVIGKFSEKIYSQVIPVGQSSFSVISF